MEERYTDLDPKRFKKRILGWRVRFKLTQAKLADELGVSQHIISCWERGTSFPSAYNEGVMLEWWRKREKQKQKEDREEQGY